MGRILHSKFRRYADKILDKYQDIFTNDYKKNVKILNLVSRVPSKRLRNKVAGYITKQMKYRSPVS
ncbi:30S ribosomal protein S17e [Nanobdella aerobiophila]|uniref:Small ribosomal subunit protein eS17 n=1 Tax=Nanobdella aerobiophila TaxID=2586965 RepID=A0A915SFV3_9ARCH|nr:30S ribosomal protein S17e [Nanobdella aerobiophila]BBL45644.1 30S ribosomal protein S17e [Nanobdella aerobiophila]